MTASLLRFDCSACGITLEVPAEQTGVRGPCPACGESITAPEKSWREKKLPTEKEESNSDHKPTAEETVPRSLNLTPIQKQNKLGNKVFAEAKPTPPPKHSLFTKEGQPAGPNVHPLPDDPPFPLEREIRPPVSEEGCNPTAKKVRTSFRELLLTCFAFLIAAALVLVGLDFSGWVPFEKMRELFTPPPTENTNSEKSETLIIPRISGQSEEIPQPNSEKPAERSEYEPHFE